MPLSTTTYSVVEFAKKQLKHEVYFDVRLYYTRHGEKFRPSIGIKLEEVYLLESGKISSRHPNYEEIVETIKTKHGELENIIRAYINTHREKPPVAWLRKKYDELELEKKRLAKKSNEGGSELDDEFPQGPVGPPEELFRFWKSFITEKQGVVRSESTIAGFEMVKYAFEKFSQQKNQALRFDLLDQPFFNDFISYMLTEHLNKRHKNQDAAEIGVKNSTLIKRLKDFSDYLTYCQVEKERPIKIDRVKRYMTLAKRKAEVRQLSKTVKWELTLTPEEIQFVVNLDQFEPDFWNSISETQKRWLDIFVFMCLQGTSPVDTKDIRRPDIRNGKIVKERSKSGNDFKVELDPISEEILEKYNYNLDFSEPTVNEGLKKLFVTIFELYRRHFEKKYNEPYQLIYSQVAKKGSESIYTIQHKGYFVECSTGRKSFLTNANDGADEVDIKANMERAGHTRIETSLGYSYEQQKPGKKRESLFNVRRIKNKESEILDTMPK